MDAGMSKIDFASELKVSDSLIALLESGKRNLTSRTASDICEKFNVNPHWLETGEGNQYNESIPVAIKLLKAEYNLDDLDVKIIEKYLELSPIERQVFKDYIKKIKSAD
jgi:transcriptional regulator with XRE-family HTH domain